MGLRPVRPLDQPRGWAYALGAGILKPTLFSAVGHTWGGGEHVPATGGCVVALNHVTKVDPLFAAHFLYDHGRLPRYLAKSGLFEVKGLGGFLHGAGQIPVQRESAGASAYAAAVAAVRAGECVVVYPEGTITRDPDLWPMTGKSGAARIALATGCPVIPVAQWGAQDVLAPYARAPRLLPRKHVTVQAGPPVDLADLLDLAAGRDGAGGNDAAARAREATHRIMDAVTLLLAGIRHEQPPSERFDPRAAGVSEFGRPEAVPPSDPPREARGEDRPTTTDEEKA
ncbi:lysophospholipid acyltransferase family protein [Nocardioides zeae]|uniref:Lysophospholipid acyltransferase family protein n=1 Tax=Nocardioides imazamoxiresistens TaxID=3231893 RepID=A0ABU3PXL6_9ACTN|nr:lysophospholipid acyltransferase family protein [Nocardioides zeae]MDT9593914.1 lysophospholipid acyltransferase family protein [Nocardioides zeae]